jgi:hypothetical protein
MTTYRAYRVDRRRHIQSAAWLDAPTDAAAKAKAAELCNEDVPVVELWQASRLVEEIECSDDDS